MAYVIRLIETAKITGLRFSFIVVFLLTKYLIANSFRIHKIDLLEYRSEYLIHYFRLGSRTLYSATANEIYNDITLLNEFNAEDAAYIGYLVGRTKIMKKNI